ncbi:MAG TPA: HAD-IB family hydrolase [Mycobacterium sp.]
MSVMSERLEQIRSAPTGEKVAAFFEYDGTLIDGSSARAMLGDRIRRLNAGRAELGKAVLTMLRGVESEQDYAGLLESNKSFLADKTVAEMTESTEKMFRHDAAARLRPQMWEIVQAHREMSHRIVIASSANQFEIVPVARELDADHALATELEVIDGVLTGATSGRPLWGPGKAAAVRALAREHDLDLTESFAYSDANADVPFLEAVGHPVTVCPDDQLRAEARARAWPILDIPKRSQPVGELVARTAAYYGSFVAGAALGALVGAFRRDPTVLANNGLPLGNDVGLALAGIRVQVVSGEEHLTAARPCVFVINHQSKLDAGILFKLLRSGFTGIAKKEARDIPVIGQILASAGVVFIDRANTGKAINQLEPAVAKLRDEGVSVALSPEGTRSVTPRLGPFRKGAFHTAMQAGVPVVPIVIRNAGELMWRDAQLMHPGTIEVRVLPPVATSEWEPATVAAHAEEVRDMFVHTLANWQEEL